MLLVLDADLRTAEVSIVMVGARVRRPGFGDGDFLPPAPGAAPVPWDVMTAVPCSQLQAVVCRDRSARTGMR